MLERIIEFIYIYCLIRMYIIIKCDEIFNLIVQFVQCVILLLKNGWITMGPTWGGGGLCPFFTVELI